jgi:phosphatidylserine decarboxylase
MKFGSRMDVFLPLDGEIFVAVGQKVVAGETIIAGFSAVADRAGGPGRA